MTLGTVVRKIFFFSSTEIDHVFGKIQRGNKEGGTSRIEILIR